MGIEIDTIGLLIHLVHVVSTCLKRNANVNQISWLQSIQKNRDEGRSN